MADYEVSQDIGINLPTRTSDPSSPVEGTIWHRSDLNEIHYYLDGVFGVAAGGVASRIKTGTYTGDGTVSLAITGIGFQPKYLKIWEQEVVDNSTVYTFETSDVIIDDIAGGASIRKSDTDTFRHKDNRIKSLDADGFTVSDDSIDAHPNKNTRVYNYLAIG